jgi:hypothetical protein
VLLQRPTIFSAAIRQYPQERDLLLLEKRQHAIIEQVSRYQRLFAVIELHKHDFTVGIDEGLLVETPNALDCADIIGVLRTQIAGMLGLNLALGFFFLLAFRQRHHLRFGQNKVLFSDFLFQRG